MTIEDTNESQALLSTDMGSVPQTWVPRINLVAPSPIDMFTLREDQIRGLAAPNAGIAFGLFTLFAGLAVAFVIVIATIDTLSDREYAGFLAATIGCAGLTVMTLVAAIREYMGVRKALDAIIPPKRTGN